MFRAEFPELLHRPSQGRRNVVNRYQKPLCHLSDRTMERPFNRSWYNVGWLSRQHIAIDRKEAIKHVAPRVLALGVLPAIDTELLEIACEKCDGLLGQRAGTSRFKQR